MIRKATLKDIDKLIEITKACTSNIIKQNIYQWDEFYPNNQAFFKGLDRNELYILELENTIIGRVTISIFMDKEYIPVS